MCFNVLVELLKNLEVAKHGSIPFTGFFARPAMLARMYNRFHSYYPLCRLHLLVTRVNLEFVVSYAEVQVWHQDDIGAGLTKVCFHEPIEDI